MPSTLMQNALLIAKREYLERIRSKAFKISTVLIPLVFGLITSDPLVRASTESVTNYGRRAELHLKPGADTQALLRLFTQSVQVLRYELVEPSLEEIFIQIVGGSVHA